MDEIGLSLKMKRLTAWLDTKTRPDRLIRKQLSGAPFGDAYLTIDPEHQSAFASANLNRVYWCGREAGVDADSAARLIELFASEGVRRVLHLAQPRSADGCGPRLDRAERAVAHPPHRLSDAVARPPRAGSIQDGS